MGRFVVFLFILSSWLLPGALWAVLDSELAPELLSLKEMLTASHYEEVLTRGTAMRDSLANTKPDNPLRDAQLLDLIVNAGYRSSLVMEQRFLDMAHRSVALTEEHAGPNSLPAATSRMHLANLMLRRGDWAPAIPQFKQAIDILAELGPQHDQQRAVLLCGEGVALRRTGQYDEARQRYEQALAIQEVVIGPDHHDLASTLNNLAIIHQNTGNYRQSRAMYRRALAIREAHFGPEHEWVAETLHNLANVETNLGAYDEALRVQERAVAIFRKTLGENHQRYLWARLNLGMSYLEMGDHVGASPICEEVLVAQQHIYGLEHIDTTYSLDALGSCRYKDGRYDEAYALYARSLGITEATLGVGNPESGPTMFEVGRCQVALGHLTEGTATMSRSLAMQDSTAGETSAEICKMLQNLSAAHLRMSRPADALGFARRSQKILKFATGTEHPSYAEATLLEAKALAALGETDKAIELALTAENISRHHLQVTMRALSEARALDYAANRIQGLDVALSLLQPGETSASVTMAWDAVIRSRAVVLDEFTARNTTLSNQSSPQAIALLDSCLTVREYLANLSLRGPGYQDPESYLAELNESCQELDRLERQLSLIDARLGQERKARELGQSEVWAQLTPGTAMVSYVLYRRPVGDPVADRKVGHVMAIVAAAHLTGPVAVELGTAAEITNLVKGWRDQVRFGSQGAGTVVASRERGLVKVAHGKQNSLEAYLEAAHTLRRAVWDPLQEFLGDSERVFIVPAGVLHRVNFGALPTEQGTFMAETGPLLHTLMTERSLVRLAGREKMRPGVLAIGDPEFGTAVTTVATEQSPCVDLATLRFDPLPHARQEVEQLADVWRNANPSSEVRILTGGDATERAFKEQLGQHGILHLATHGFVLNDHCRQDILKTTARADALNLTGLALQGANEWAHAVPGDEDGILTASEISALDMTGVDWAVLSACDTGLGDLTARGEGVFGLCRAFALAGARTVIVSLWPVGDETAHDWMQALYTAHLIDGVSTDRAVQSAHRTVLAERRAQGQSVHPYYWAGFTAIGDWQ